MIKTETGYRLLCLFGYFWYCGVPRVFRFYRICLAPIVYSLLPSFQSPWILLISSYENLSTIPLFATSTFPRYQNIIMKATHFQV